MSQLLTALDADQCSNINSSTYGQGWRSSQRAHFHQHDLRSHVARCHMWADFGVRSGFGSKGFQSVFTVFLSLKNPSILL